MSNYLLATGTIVAALFVAVQAWYARIAYVEDTETRFLEKKLDICFENFDQAAQLDAALRYAVPGTMDQPWPPRVRIDTPDELEMLQREVVPGLNALEAGLTKASVLGPLDKYRRFLSQQLRGLSKALLDLTPAQLAPESGAAKPVLAKLSDFIGAQYPVFTGCRMVAEGKT